MVEVILVGNALVGRETQVGQRQLLRMVAEGDGWEISERKGFGGEDTAVEVRVGPATGALHEVVAKGD